MSLSAIIVRLKGFPNEYHLTLTKVFPWQPSSTGMKICAGIPSFLEVILLLIEYYTQINSSESRVPFLQFWSSIRSNFLSFCIYETQVCSINDTVLALESLQV